VVRQKEELIQITAGQAVKAQALHQHQSGTNPTVPQSVQ
jgi:hypothetical protein